MGVAQVDSLEGVCISRHVPWQRYAVEEPARAGTCGLKDVSGRRLHSQGVNSCMLLHHVLSHKVPLKRSKSPTTSVHGAAGTAETL